jgi:hypothetical protein
MVAPIPFPHGYTHRKETATAVNQLADLLQLLYPDPTPDIITLTDFRNRYPLTGLGKPAITAIETAQRIHYATQNPEQTGLCEFHIGLIYLYWGNFDGAAHQFYWARRHWALIGKPETNALAYLAEAHAQHLGYHHEQAMQNLQRAHHTLPRLRFTTHNPFTQELTHHIHTLIQIVRHALHPEEIPTPNDQTQSTPPDDQTTAPHQDEEPTPGMPINNLSSYLPTPLPGHLLIDPLYRWYQVHRSVSRFMPDIHDNDWILVYMKPEPPSDQLGTNQKILIMYDEDLQIEDTILLKPRSTEQAYRIYFTNLKRDSGNFINDMETGNVTFWPTQTLLDPAKLLGIVIGLWRPYKHISKPNV